MVQFSFSRFSTLLAYYDLKLVAYKPTPVLGLGATNSSVSNSSSAPAAVARSFIGSPQSFYWTQGTMPLRQRRKVTRKNHTETLDAGDSSCGSEQVYDAPPVLSQTPPLYDQTTANVYKYRQQQSVNLGSWFVHENWMTPSVFKCASGKKVSEIDVAQGWGSTKSARAVLERHWDTFIQASDFQYLASIGINTVRLPIGYWNLGPDYMQGTPFESVAEVYENSWPRVLRAINEAGDYGLGVLVDLHGAVGSQNGQPHSGISDDITNLFDVAENMDKTVDVLSFIAQQLATFSNVVGIQLLNEPQYPNGTVLEDFYTRAITAVRASSPAAIHLPAYVHDGFQMDRFSDFVATRTDFVVQDHHSYFVFSPADQTESGAQHMVDVKGAIAESLEGVSTKQRRNLVVDEWSCALTPASMAEDKDSDQVRKQFCEEQMKVYGNTTAGWAFWSYMKEDCDNDPGWCFKAAVGKTLPATFFNYDKSSVKEANNIAEETSDLIMPTASAHILELFRQVGPSMLDRRLKSDWDADARIPHRFAAIHRQRDAQNVQGNDTPTNSTSRGFADGLTTAKIFGAYNMSRLGFSGQFVADAIRVAGPVLIAEGTEGDYSTAFLKGLQHGESGVFGTRRKQG